MMNESEQLLEIYKLHAELADKVSQRREGANRLYISLLVGLAVFLAALLRFGVGNNVGLDDGPVRMILCVAGAIGVLLSICWYVVIRSYRQLNTGKFKALHELEGKLAYPFFKREWDLLAEGRDTRRYWKLTIVETSLPCIFFALFLGLAIFSCSVSWAM